MWREIVLRLLPDAQLASGVDPGDGDTAARALREALPGDLISLLLETNGIIGCNGLDVVWRLDRIIADNRMCRSSSEFTEL